MMSESIDETLDKDEAEEETEELTNQVIVTTYLSLHSLHIFNWALNYIQGFYLLGYLFLLLSS